MLSVSFQTVFCLFVGLIFSEGECSVMYWPRNPSQRACGNSEGGCGAGSVLETVVRSRLWARLRPWAVCCASASGSPL